MLPDNVNIGLSQSRKILFCKKTCNDCDNFRLSEFGVAFPVAGFVAAFFDALERIHLDAHSLRFEQEKPAILLSPNNQIRFLQSGTLDFSFF